MRITRYVRTQYLCRPFLYFTFDHLNPWVCSAPRLMWVPYTTVTASSATTFEEIEHQTLLADASLNRWCSPGSLHHNLAKSDDLGLVCCRRAVKCGFRYIKLPTCLRTGRRKYVPRLLWNAKDPTGIPGGRAASG